MRNKLSRREFTSVLGAAACGTVLSGGLLGVTGKTYGGSNILNKKFSNTPDYIKTIPERMFKWQEKLRCPEYFGLYKDCIDSQVPFAFPASNIVVNYMKYFGLLDQIPDYSKRNIKKTIKFVRSCQQKDTGLIIHPYLDEQFVDKQDERAHWAFREAATRYTRYLLIALGSGLKYPFSSTGGESGKTDGDAFLQYVETSNWDQPWATGSKASLMTVEIFDEINQGNLELIPVLEKGLELMMSHQNPETGMIGSSSIPLHQQISGSLKIYPKLVRSLGMTLPHLNRLADSCIKHQADKSFYTTDDMCIPRNILEITELCLILSDYRKEELLETISSVIDYIHDTYMMPDGMFASDSSGMRAIGWGGASIAPQADTPRSNINGTQAALHAFSIAAEYLQWDTPLKHPIPESVWRKDLAKRKYIAQLTPKGRVKIVPNPNYVGL